MHVIFDLDGTLTDSKPGIVACLRHALAALEYELDPAIDLDPFLGPPLRDVFAELCGGAVDIEKAVAHYRARYADTGLFENRVYDGIEASLARLAASAESIYIATSKPTVYAERIVDHFGLKPYFRQVYGASLDGRLGNKAELLAQLLADEDIDPARAVMIGDRHYDVVGAGRNGLRAIGVLWGYGSADELSSAGAERLCAHPAELHACIFDG